MSELIRFPGTPSDFEGNAAKEKLIKMPKRVPLTGHRLLDVERALEDVLASGGATVLQPELLVFEPGDIPLARALASIMGGLVLEGGLAERHGSRSYYRRVIPTGAEISLESPGEYVPCLAFGGVDPPGRLTEMSEALMRDTNKLLEDVAAPVRLPVS